VAGPSSPQPLILLGDLSQLRVRAELDEHNVGKIKIGEAVAVRAEAFRGQTFAGKVAAIAPLILVWCGYGSLSKVVTAALVAFFPVLVNTIIGLRSCEQSKLDLMRSLRASRWLTFRLVELPNALPFIFAGLSVAAVFSILGALVGEFVGSKDGIGFLILDANYQLNIPRVFALLILLGLYGIICHLALQFAHKKLVFWNEPKDVTSA